MARTYAILIALLVAVNAMIAGNAIGTARCLGGHAGHDHCHAEHEHDASEAAPCGSESCMLEAALLTQAPMHSHHRCCHCTDVQVYSIAASHPSRLEKRSVAGHAFIAAAEPTVPRTCGLEVRGPARAPPWFDPGRAQRLAVVSAVRLTI